MRSGLTPLSEYVEFVDILKLVVLSPTTSLLELTLLTQTDITLGRWLVRLQLFTAVRTCGRVASAVQSPLERVRSAVCLRVIRGVRDEVVVVKVSRACRLRALVCCLVLRFLLKTCGCSGAWAPMQSVLDVIGLLTPRVVMDTVLMFSLVVLSGTRRQFRTVLARKRVFMARVVVVSLWTGRIMLALPPVITTSMSVMLLFSSLTSVVGLTQFVW